MIEKSAPAGYLIADPVEFTIDENVSKEDGIDVEMEDDYTKITIRKHAGDETDETKNLAGAELVLVDEDGNEICLVRYKETAEGSSVQKMDVATWTTTTAADQFVRVPAGTYYLTEKNAPDEYMKSKPVTVVVLETAEEQVFTMTDQRIIRLPVTGGNGNTLPYIPLMLLTVMMAFAGLTVSKKKKNS